MTKQEFLDKVDKRYRDLQTEGQNPFWTNPWIQAKLIKALMDVFWDMFEEQEEIYQATQKHMNHQIKAIHEELIYISNRKDND